MIIYFVLFMTVSGKRFPCYCPPYQWQPVGVLLGAINFPQTIYRYKVITKFSAPRALSPILLSINTSLIGRLRLSERCYPAAQCLPFSILHWMATCLTNYYARGSNISCLCHWCWAIPWSWKKKYGSRNLCLNYAYFARPVSAFLPDDHLMTWSAASFSRHWQFAQSWAPVCQT